MKRSFVMILTFGLLAFVSMGGPNPQLANARDEQPGESRPGTVSGIEHIFWIWFENRDSTAITAATAPTLTNFGSTYVNFTNFFGITHPSQPNYLAAFSGSTQGVVNDGHFTFPASTDNLAKQLLAAGKTWRLYAQNLPSVCFDGDTSTNGVVDGPGVTGKYDRKHVPAMSFESVRLNPTECAKIQPLANFDPSVNFAFIAPNEINNMHDGTTAQGDAFLAAFLPLVTNSPDWAHTLLIVSFDEGSPGNHIYTAAGAPWLTHADIGTLYDHYNVLRTIEEVYGLPFLGGAATATTMTELFPPAGSPTPTMTPSPFPEYDLTISQTDAPDPVVSGGHLTYTLTVTNSPSALGGGACPNVRFTYPTGVPFAFSSASGTGGFGATPDAGGVTFSGGCLSSQNGTPQSATLTVVITPQGTGTLTSLGSNVVVDPENNWNEDNENNNTAATVTTTVQSTPTPTSTPTNFPTPFPEYDLTVSQTDAPDPVVSGGHLTYTLTVTNSPSALGGGACPNVRFTYPTGVPFAFSSASGTGGFGATPDAGGVTFSGGCLSSQNGTSQSATLTVVITPQGTGTLTSFGSNVVVDPENSWNEDNENNNTAATVTTMVEPTPSPTPTPPGSPAITGTVIYGNALGSPTPRLVSNVTISGAGSPNVSTTTTFPDGRYSLSGFGAGSYTITAAKTTGQNSITSFDAARVAQHAAGTISLTGNQLAVADVSSNGTVSSFDAGLIAKYVVSTQPFGTAGNWVFDPVNRPYASVTSDITGQDYSALLMGEVSGNWSNSAARPVDSRQLQSAAAEGGLIDSPANSSDGPERRIVITTPRAVTPTNAEVLIPVSVEGTADKGIISYEFDLRYDPSVMQPLPNPVDLAGTISSKLSVVVGTEEEGLLRVAVYGPMPIDSDGVLLNLRFTAIRTAGSVSPLTWERIMFNEGDTSVMATDAQVEISAAAPNRAKISGRVLTQWDRVFQRSASR